MSRGFGGTFGVGVNDMVRSAFTSVFSTQFSIGGWIYINGAGGSSLGRVFAVTSSGNQKMSMNGSTASMAFNMVFSTTSGQWTFTAPATGVWHHILVTYDGSATTNKPIVYINGTSVTVTTGTTPVGTFAPTANPLDIGNHNGGGRNWDGMIAHFALWNGIILGSEVVRALSSGINPIIISPEYLVSYLPLDGINKPEFDFVNKPSVSITSTLLGTSNPPVIPLYRNIDLFADTSGTTYNNSLSETITSSDSESAVATDTISLSEASTSSDTSSVFSSDVITLSETETSSDSYIIGSVYLNSLSETITSSDAENGLVTMADGTTETILSVDQYLPTAIDNVTDTESLAANDNYSITGGTPAIVTIPTTGSGDDPWKKYLKWLEKKKRKQLKSAGNRKGLSEYTAHKMVEKTINEIQKKEVELKAIYQPSIDQNIIRNEVQKLLLAEYSRIWEQQVQYELYQNDLQESDDEEALMVMML